MSYRAILVDLTADEPVEERLSIARSLALRFDAVLVGMHVVPPPFEPSVWEGTGGVYLPPALIEAERKANQEIKQRIQTSFNRICGADPAMTWREAEGQAAMLLAEAARTADLAVTARDRAGAGGASATIQELVLGGGVPVLVLPPHRSSGVGSTVLVAWNGSREATRAAHDALPFLQHSAKPVILCAIGEQAAANLDQAIAMLERHKVPVHPERLEGSDAHAGEILLAQAVAHGADLLVMGAYGHSRLRELVFGGATRHVLCHAHLPVLLSS